MEDQDLITPLPESVEAVTKLIDTLEEFMDSTSPKEMFKVLISKELASRTTALIGFCVDTTLNAEMLGLLPDDFLNKLREFQQSEATSDLE